MSIIKFAELTTALKEHKTSFEIAGFEGQKRTSCMSYKYGNCQLIYGFDVHVRENESLPSLDLQDKPMLIAIADIDGKHPVIVDRFTFMDTFCDAELDVELEPFTLRAAAEHMNRVEVLPIIEAFKDKLSLNDFPADVKSEVIEHAAQAARATAFDAKEFEPNYYDVVYKKDYLDIRCGKIAVEAFTMAFCEEHKTSLMVDKEAERLLTKGVLTEREELLSEMFQRLDGNVQYLTVNFECNGIKHSNKITPDSLRNAVRNSRIFGKYLFKDSRGADSFMAQLSRYLSIDDIESITYGKKVLYTRPESSEKEKRKPKCADTYER